MQPTQSVQIRAADATRAAEAVALAAALVTKLRQRGTVGGLATHIAHEPADGLTARRSIATASGGAGRVPEPRRRLQQHLATLRPADSLDVQA